MNEFFGKVTYKKYLNPHVVELGVEVDKVHFEPGQYVGFKIGNTARSYSIISNPSQSDQLAFCVELIEGGVGSEYIKKLSVGDSMTLQGPFGQFVLNDYTHPVCFIATGVGIAPFRSIIPHALDNGHTQSLSLLFGARAEEDILYKDDFAALADQYKNFTFIPMLTSPPVDWEGEKGRVTEYVQSHYDEIKNNLIYVCGSLEMIKDVRALLLDRGHAFDDIKLEIFT